ncbi:MAG: OB-fold domain-containing protein [Congregibacter sp.]
MLRTQPTRSALTEPWFEACRDGRLLIQRCGDCGHYQFYPRIVCTRCSSEHVDWVEASGDAVIASFTVVRHAVSKAYEAPYVVALVDLAEGPRLMTNIIHSDFEALRIGMPVRLQFEQWDEDVSLPVFAVETAETAEHNPVVEEALAP